MVEDLLEYVYGVRLAVTILNTKGKVREQYVNSAAERDLGSL
jgi:hypothetical protein